MTGAVDIKILYNDGRFCVSSDTVYSERHGGAVIIFQLQDNGDIVYRGLDLSIIKKIKHERER
jgi:hypothetical protein